MSTRTISCEGFNKGMFMSWYVTTQADNKITVTLSDSQGTYFSNSKKSTEIEPPLAQGDSIILGTDLKILIESSAEDEIKLWMNNTNITSATSGKRVGQYFVASGEDQDNGDQDYNDICISLVAWNQKG